MNHRQSKAREKERFTALLHPVIGIAYRVAFNLTSNQADAEELVQDAAVLAFSHFDSYQQDSHFKAWFMKIMRNCFLMSVRKQKQKPPSLDLSDLQDAYLYTHVVAAGLYTKTDDPAHLIMQQLDADHIADAFQALPEEYRIVAIFYFVEQRSYQEIAEYMAVPVGTVRSRLHRGRKMLQKRLWPLTQDVAVL